MRLVSSWTMNASVAPEPQARRRRCIPRPEITNYDNGPVVALIAASIAACVALLIAFLGVNARMFTRLGRVEQAVDTVGEGLSTTRKELREYFQ